VKIYSLMVILASVLAGFGPALPAHAQSSGPLLPHAGGQITTAFSNRFGPDAESTVTFTSVTGDVISLNYASTRGLTVNRDQQVSDRQSSRIYVLGYGLKMPVAIPGTTSLGISSAVLVELRDTGKTLLSLVFDDQQSQIDGQLRLVQKDVKFPVMVENQIVQVPAVHATGTFGFGAKTGIADFYFLDNKNNPIMLQSTIQFSWETQLRSERVIRITAGASMRSAMEQALSTLRKYEIYGLHFDFNKSTLRPESDSLIQDIVTTLKANPTWKLQIDGHTDSIGDAAYNQKLSVDRAKAVTAALVVYGIEPGRLQTGGFGETQPKGDNATLDGRALNRRVELSRTDR